MVPTFYSKYWLASVRGSACMLYSVNVIALWCGHEFVNEPFMKNHYVSHCVGIPFILNLLEQMCWI